MRAKDVWPLITIYIVESPSPDDLFNNRKEGEALTKALELIGCNFHYFLTVDKTNFEKSLLEIAQLHSSKYKKTMPIIHLSAHGSEQGIALTNGVIITWDELGRYLTPINVAVLKRSLVLCMSSCYGLSMKIIGEGIPYLLLVSFDGSPSWRETIVGFIAFYNILGKESDFVKATEAARIASGNETFTWVAGKSVRFKPS